MAQPAHPALLGTVIPQYAPARGETRAAAHFPDSEPVPVNLGRTRWYPQVNSAAPCMLAVYEIIAAGLNDEQVVWDVGCGVGAGTRILAANGRNVVGWDEDENAVAYAKHYAPGQRFESCDPAFGGLSKNEATPDLVTLVDVLSVAKDPRALLSGLRKCSHAGTRLLLAEPRASATQVLAHPARRAYSERQLEVLLFQCGWLVERQLTIAPGIAALCALPHPNYDGREYDLASIALANGDLTLARSLLEQLLLQTDNPKQRAQVALDIADVCFGLRDGDGAFTAINQASTDDKEEPGVRAGMARLSSAMGNHEEALIFAVQAVESDPVDARTVTALADTAELAQSPQAGEAWAMAAALLPDDPGVLTQRARCAAASGQPTLAIAALEQLRSYHPDPDPALSLTLAWLLCEVGRHAEAELEARIASASGAPEADVAELLKTLREQAAKN